MIKLWLERLSSASSSVHDSLLGMRNLSAAILALTVSLVAQGNGYSTGFESFSASAAGTPCAGQDGFYVPATSTSIDGSIYTYAGNALGIAANPSGGANFFAGTSTGTFYPRADRAVGLPSGGRVRIDFDVCVSFVGTAPVTNNVGSVSLQPAGTARIANLVARWPTGAPTPPTTWDADVMTGASVLVNIGDPDFQGLPVGVWHRWGCTIDLTTSEYIEFRITNGSTGLLTTFRPAAGTMLLSNPTGSIPTGFRLFAGGGEGNTFAVDNLTIAEPPVGPRDVAVDDIDGDGDLDAVTANSLSGNLALWRNDGAGALGAPEALALTASDQGPEAVAIGDLDDDGARDDLAVACADSHTVVFVTDVGSATRTVVSLAAGGMHPVDVAVFDLDADPRDDVVVGLEGTPFGGGDGIAVSLDGGAFTAVTIPAPYPRKAVRLAHGDLDGDGDQDLAVLAQGGVDHILLFTGAGDGSLSFAGGIALPTGGLARGLCIDDLDGDGDLDLAVVLPTLFPTPTTDLRIYLYTASGALDPTDYTSTADFPTSGTFGIDVASGDVDDDGLSDFAVVHAGSGDVALLRGFDGAAFASTETPTVGTGPIAITAGDLNRDGGDDFVVANQASNDLSVLSFAQIALAQPYGTGCTGTGGLVPQITGIDLPVQPSATFGVQLADARAFAPALLLFAGDPDALDLGGGCTVLVALPAASTLRFTNGLGADAFVFGVPASPALLGLDLYFQYAVFDPAGAYLNALALSNGLRVQVGI